MRQPKGLKESMADVGLEFEGQEHSGKFQVILYAIASDSIQSKTLIESEKA